MAKGYYENHYTFKRLRVKKLKETKGKCETCGNAARIIHHIDGNQNNHDAKNLIALCTTCHGACHADDGPSVRADGTPRKKYSSGFVRAYGYNQAELADMAGCTISDLSTLHRLGVLKDFLDKIPQYQARTEGG